MLHVVMYHYVRDLANTAFPRIHGMSPADFRRQVRWLRKRFDFVTLEGALSFLRGDYRTSRDLCLLTFDDGFKEHCTEVTPILVEEGVQGVFFVISGCLEEHEVAAAHQNHFLMASLEFSKYQAAFLERLKQVCPQLDTSVSTTAAQAVYRWDRPAVARFKYLLNFQVPEDVRRRILGELFTRQFGDERAFARQLYLSWDDARQMQACGMVIGGHSHRHRRLAALDESEQREDVNTCAELLRNRLVDQQLWPFSYPFGKPSHSFDRATERIVAESGFACAFATHRTSNRVGQHLSRLGRFDSKDFACC